jgi:hypothetical protein
MSLLWSRNLNSPSHYLALVLCIVLVTTNRCNTVCLLPLLEMKTPKDRGSAYCKVITYI